MWCADARLTTASFLEQDHPDLAERYLRADTVERLLVEEEEPLVAPQDRDGLEADLRSRGHEVRRWPTLAESFLEPAEEELAALRKLF